MEVAADVSTGSDITSIVIKAGAEAANCSFV